MAIQTGVQIVVLYKDGARTDTFFSNSETRARVEPMLYNIFEAESQKKSLRDCGVNTTEEWPTEVKAKTPAKRKQSSSGDGIGKKSAKKKSDKTSLGNETPIPEVLPLQEA